MDLIFHGGPRDGEVYDDLDWEPSDNYGLWHVPGYKSLVRYIPKANPDAMITTTGEIYETVGDIDEHGRVIYNYVYIRINGEDVAQ